MSVPPVSDDTNPHADDQTLRWAGAIVLPVVLHAGWMVFTAWYMHLDKRGFLLGGCYEEYDPEKYGIHAMTRPCPPDRPYADVIKWAVPIIGLLVGSFLPPVALRIPMDGFSEEA